jgi:hypothetical protein
MLADEETQSDYQLRCALQEIKTMFAHIQEDMHAQARRQDRVDKLLTEFEPIIRLYASPVSAYTASRRARKTHKEPPPNG